MTKNNLNFDIALYPCKMATYGQSGQNNQNWMQYQLIRKYLEDISED